jgi:hypothetical protein
MGDTKVDRADLRFKACVSGRSVAGIAGPTPTGGMDV